MKTIQLSSTDSPETSKDLINVLREIYDKGEICLFRYQESAEAIETILIPNNGSFSSIVQKLQKEEGCMWSEFKWDDPDITILLKLCAIQCASTNSYQKFLMGKYFAMVGKEYYEKHKEESKIRLIKNLTKK